MSTVPWLSLHSLTRTSIELQLLDFRDGYDCGCDVHLTTLSARLCQYHRGFEDGINLKETQP